MARRPRYRTGDDTLDAAIAELVEDAGGDPDDLDLIAELVVSAAKLASDKADRGDLKIANAALKEMRYAFRAFAPYRGRRKIAIFGSARTRADDPLYAAARAVAAAFAAREWMIITGAGPGIMEAGVEGAGADNSFGVSIRLPFETVTSQFVADDPKLINFRYFFTRKLAFVKESHGFVLLPGGFGTMDEALELLTLMQTGKTAPAPVVALDVPGGTYWRAWKSFMESELERRHYISPHDFGLFLVTDDIDAAVREVITFYANYHSLRFVAGHLVLRVQRAPDDATLEALSHDFADILVQGAITRTDVSGAERRDDDHIDLERVHLHFDRRSWARLRALIDALNRV